MLLAYYARLALAYIKADGLRSASWQEQLARNAAWAVQEVNDAAAHP